VAGSTAFALEGVGVGVTHGTVGVIGSLMVQVGLTGCIVSVDGGFAVTDLADASRSGMSAGIVAECGHIVEHDRNGGCFRRRPVTLGRSKRTANPLDVVRGRIVTGRTGKLPVLAASNTPATVLGTEIVTVVHQCLTGRKCRAGGNDHYDRQ